MCCSDLVCGLVYAKHKSRRYVHKRTGRNSKRFDLELCNFGQPAEHRVLMAVFITCSLSPMTLELWCFDLRESVMWVHNPPSPRHCRSYGLRLKQDPNISLFRVRFRA